MAWIDEIQVCSYKGFEFNNLLNMGDDFNRQLAESKYLYNPGSFHDDTGRDSFQISFTCFFRGDDCIKDYTDFLILILNDKGEAGEFIHPFLGSFTGYLFKGKTRYDSKKRDYIEMDCQFVEDQAEFDILQQAEESSFASATSDASSALTDTTTAWNDAMPDTADAPGSTTATDPSANNKFPDNYQFPTNKDVNGKTVALTGQDLKDNQARWDQVLSWKEK